MILDTTTIDRNVALTADVCVVGSGAGGSLVAYELAQQGRSVVVVEEGGYQVARDFSQREDEMYPRLYQDQGVRAASDATVLISQGRAVGGSTITGYCICARPPRQILDRWATQFGIRGVGAEDMEAHYRRVEDALHVQELTAEQINKNNQLVQAGAERLGFHAVRLTHNRIDCLGCGYCALGCAYDRKTDALAVHLRAASLRGAIIVPDCRVDRVTTENGRASGVSGTFGRTAGASATLTVSAKVVVLAAGAIGSPQLWLRSQLPNTQRQVGRNLHLHPQVWVAGVFSEEVGGWHGIPQSIVVDQFFSVEETRDGGFWLAPTFAHPMALAALLPGLGADHRRLMELYPHLSVTAAVLHDQSSGSVEIDASGRAVVGYHLTDEDRNALADAMRRAADVYFAAGAERVVLPFNESVELTRRGEYRAIDEHPLQPNDPMLLSFHPQGSLRMGATAARGVVNAVGEAYEVPGLFVADASVFPTAIAVPPQLSVMAFASRTGQLIADNAARYFRSN
ncbi:MAG TPA: GMC family oxidoreductase [Candidatus Kryptonia bacterium]|nr:GMC family oxidoreductase [Candidatus Kryptonia bacterium]